MADFDPVILHPAGFLRFGGSHNFWCQKLFELGCMSVAGLNPVQLFWRNFAASAISALCHAPIDQYAQGWAERLAQLPLDAVAFLNTAPPMPGGEYLSAEVLHKVWQALLTWMADGINACGGREEFLALFAPGWHQVGNVFFHLAENKLDTERPFAFLVTCAIDVNDRGELRHTPLGNAIRKFANNRQALIRLMEPVSQASDKIKWLRRMCDSGAIYKPCAWTADDAYDFLLSAAELERYGIGVRLPDWWKKRPRPRVITEISTRKEYALGADALLNFDLQVALGDETLDEEEINSLLNERAHGLVLIKNQWVEVDSKKLGEALAHWRKIRKSANAGQLNFLQGMRLLAGLGADAADPELPEDVRTWSEVRAGNGFRELLQKAREQALPEQIPGLAGSLRPYQQEGVAWLSFLTRIGLGACLADDMGLGKTIQILSLLLLGKGKHKMPALLVVPASLLGNWLAEAARFAPDLRLLALHPSHSGMEQFEGGKGVENYDLVITTYGMTIRLPWLLERDWSLAIADEAQNIKNGRTRQSIAVRQLKAPVRIALTGTPIENSPGDLWALFDFIAPGLLGSARDFDKVLKKLQQEPAGLSAVRKLTSPYILRRMKTDKKIISSLPDKTEVTLACHLVPAQVRLYQKVVTKMERELEELQGESKQRRNLMVLQNLVLLKQICNHPAQAGLIDAYSPEKSGKFGRVGELCEMIAAKQEKVLVFSQFREILRPLEEYLGKIFGRPGLSLHGGTPVKKRLELVNEFQKDDGPPFFVISLKAGGSGLNLTAASHVIHFDRWWNPAVEDQATDRAFRIGQQKNVLVHKCVTMGTLEENIDRLIREKREVAGQILNGIHNNIMNLDDQQIMRLVRLDVNTLVD